jgi:hypothetical protein
MPTTAFGAAIFRAPALKSDRINVVDAKEKSPLNSDQLLVVQVSKVTHRPTG